MTSQADAGTPLTELRERLAVLSDLGAAQGLLGWDRETMMPPKGADARGDVLATLEAIAHERLADPALGALLDAADTGAGTGAPAGDDAAIVRVVRRDHDRATRIPVELTAAMARATAAALPAWSQAREASDFAVFRPHLERHVELQRAVSACFPDAAHPYDPLLDLHEPGATTAQVREVFATLRDGLVPLIGAIAERPAPAPLPGPLPDAGQRELALAMARAIGYDDEGWRLDDSAHPFSQVVGPGDQRVTAHWHEEDLGGIFAVLHETGHGLYEQQVGRALRRTTLDTGVSFGIHESQSRLWENQVGRSRAFWSHWLPRAKELLPALEPLDLDAFLRSVNVVAPTLIRVQADEATYALHVILRFEIEVALVDGTLAVADLPAAWNDGMRDLIGIDVPDDARGCLQDIHWAFGELGYFPTYAIGNIVSAQLWDALSDEVGGVDEALASGDCAPVRDWLREHVHRHGRTYDPDDLLRAATGSGLDPAPLLAYLHGKYGELYGL
jgi:carboxypeptidase Taq